MPDFSVGLIDILVLGGYLVLARLIPLWLTGAQEDADDFFLDGRNFAWPLIGFSLFATNMSGSSFVGLAGAGYNQGVSVYNYEWSAAVILIFFICGSLEALGAGAPDRAWGPLSAADYPVWRAEIEVPAGTYVEFRWLKKRDGRVVEWGPRFAQRAGTSTPWRIEDGE